MGFPGGTGRLTAAAASSTTAPRSRSPHLPAAPAPALALAVAVTVALRPRHLSAPAPRQSRPPTTAASRCRRPPRRRHWHGRARSTGGPWRMRRCWRGTGATNAAQPTGTEGERERERGGGGICSIVASISPPICCHPFAATRLPITCFLVPDRDRLTITLTLTLALAPTLPHPSPPPCPPGFSSRTSTAACRGRRA